MCSYMYVGGIRIHSCTYSVMCTCACNSKPHQPRCYILLASSPGSPPCERTNEGEPGDEANILHKRSCDVRNMCTHHHTSHIKCGIVATAVVLSVTEVNLSLGRLCGGGKMAWYQLFVHTPNFLFILWKI